MAFINTKIPSLCIQCVDALKSYFHLQNHSMSSAIKCFRYQVCPPKKNTYQVISKITPQLLEQIQKKSLSAGNLQPGRLPYIFSSHPLALPLVSSAGGQVEQLLNPDRQKKVNLDGRCYYRTSAVTYKCKKDKKKKKGNKCKKRKKGKKGKKPKNKCKKEKKGKKKGKKEKKKCKVGSNNACPDIKLHNCKQAKTKLCTRDSIWPKCNKNCAPYPSYSEACHEDIPLPPSECRICPYTKKTHPTFKEKTRKYHTMSHCNVPMRLPGALPLLPSMEEILPLIDGYRYGDIPPLTPLLEILCSKCGKKDEGCGNKVKNCKKDKKKKKSKKPKKDKCKKKKKGKKGKKGRKHKKGKKGRKHKKGKKGRKHKKDKKGKKGRKHKKGKCNPKWKHPPCKKPDIEHSRVCPTDLIKKPKCP